MKEVILLGPGFAAVDCCAVVADELQAEFIYEHVEGAKAGVGTGVRSVGIHVDVGVVGGSDEKACTASGCAVSSCSGVRSGRSCPRLPCT